MPGTYFDGDTSGTQYAWTGAPNLSSSTYTVAVTSTKNPASIGDLIGGSWSVTESATPIDILDTNGSTGNVSATFKNITQSISSAPGATPVTSSDFTPGQPCTYTHDTLGSISGYVLSADPNSATVKLTSSTPLSLANVNMQMPAFIEGSYFYSWKRTLADGRAWPGIQDMATNGVGNLWIVGNLSGGNALRLYDRFGNNIQSTSITGTGIAVELDTLGNIYVLTSTQLHKYDSNAVFQSTIATASGYNFVKMTIDGSNNLWVATTATGAGNAIKKFSSTGTALASYGIWSPGTIPPGGTSYNNYTGMSFSPDSNSITVGNTAGDGYGQTLFYYNKINITSGITTGPFMAGIPNGEYTSLGMDWSRTQINGSLNWKMVYFSQSGLYDNDNNYITTEIQAIPGKTNAFLADNAGGGYWLAVDDTVYRLAGGTMGPHQAIECYLGAAGYRGTMTYAANTQYEQVISQIVNFPSWEGNVWTKLKELAARSQRTITTDGAGIRIARNDTRVDEYRIDISNRESAPEITIGQPGAQVINVTSQNVTIPNAGHGLLWKAIPSDSLISVDVGEVFTSTIQTNFYATHIDAPKQALILTPNVIPNPDNDTSSQFFIVDSSYPPKQYYSWDWQKNGGDFSVELSKTVPGSIDIIFTGPNYDPNYVGPFSLGYALGNTKYSYLTITGYGITTNPQEFQVYTGAPFNVRAEIDSADMDSVFLDTASIAWDMARMSAATLGGGPITCTVDIPVSNISVPFGQIAGSYFYWKRNYWRVYDVDIDGGWAKLSATRDTRQSDVQDGSISHGQIDNIWGGFRYLDNYLSPGVLGA